MAASTAIKRQETIVKQQQSLRDRGVAFVQESHELVLSKILAYLTPTEKRSVAQDVWGLLTDGVLEPTREAVVVPGLYNPFKKIPLAERRAQLGDPPEARAELGSQVGEVQGEADDHRDHSPWNHVRLRDLLQERGVELDVLRAAVQSGWR